MSISRDDEERLSYLEFMSRETERFPVGIYVWCLITSYVNLVALREDERALTRAIGETHKRYS